MALLNQGRLCRLLLMHEVKIYDATSDFDYGKGFCVVVIFWGQFDHNNCFDDLHIKTLKPYSGYR